MGVVTSLIAHMAVDLLCTFLSGYVIPCICGRRKRRGNRAAGVALFQRLASGSIIMLALGIVFLLRIARLGFDQLD